MNQLQITNEGSLIADQPTALTINPTGNVALLNRGTVRVENGSQMIVFGSNVIQDSGAAQTIVLGTLTGPVVELQTGVLGGTCLVIASVDNVGGIVAPGASPGKLTIQGNYVQGANGTLALEIDGPAQGVEHDWLQITGNASLAGTLTLDFGYTPVVGASFVVLTTGGTVSGNFVSIGVPDGWEVTAAYNLRDVTLTVAAVPEPGSYAMMLAGLALILGTVARRRRSLAA